MVYFIEDTVFTLLQICILRYAMIILLCYTIITLAVLACYAVGVEVLSHVYSICCSFHAVKLLILLLWWCGIANFSA
jgi:hypothetical protein